MLDGADGVFGAAANGLVAVYPARPFILVNFGVAFRCHGLVGVSHGLASRASRASLARSRLTLTSPQLVMLAGERLCSLASITSCRSTTSAFTASSISGAALTRATMRAASAFFCGTDSLM